MHNYHLYTSTYYMAPPVFAMVSAIWETVPSNYWPRDDAINEILNGVWAFGSQTHHHLGIIVVLLYDLPDKVLVASFGLAMYWSQFSCWQIACMIVYYSGLWTSPRWTLPIMRCLPSDLYQQSDNDWSEWPPTHWVIQDIILDNFTPTFPTIQSLIIGLPSAVWNIVPNIPSIWQHVSMTINTHLTAGRRHTDKLHAIGHYSNRNKQNGLQVCL